MKLFTALIFLASCARNDHCYPEYRFDAFTSYPITRTENTATGIGLDDPKYELSPTRIEQTIHNVSDCIKAMVDGGYTDEEFIGGECSNRTIDAEIRQCLVIKVAPDWKVSPCSGEQIFPCNVGEYRCLQKGQTPNPQCPCSCRGLLQDGQAVIITPNMKLLPATLVTLFTGCLSPWVGRLGGCSSSKMIAE